MLISFCGILQIFFLSAEVMDIKEFRYVLVRPADLKVDMEMLLDRYKELANVDSVNYGYAFPDRTVARNFIQLNREYGHFLTKMIALYPNSRELLDARDETNFLYSTWDSLDDVTCTVYLIHIRKRGLKKLRERLDRIDPTWYDKGIMPPPVPIYRFMLVK